MRVAYNHEIINIIREKEIKELKEEIKDINISFKEKIKMNNDVKKKFKKRDLKNMSIGRALSIINGPQTAEDEKKLAISEKEKKIDLISKMTLWEYLEHHKEKEKEKEKEEFINEQEESINSDSTMDEAEQKLSQLEKLIKEDKNLKYLRNKKINKKKMGIKK